MGLILSVEGLKRKKGQLLQGRENLVSRLPVDSNCNTCSSLDFGLASSPRTYRDAYVSHRLFPWRTPIQRYEVNIKKNLSNHRATSGSIQAKARQYLWGMRERGFLHLAGRKMKCLNFLPTLRPSMMATAAYLAEGNVLIRLGLGVQASLSFSLITMHQQDRLLPAEARSMWNTSFTEWDSCLVREHQLPYHPTHASGLREDWVQS